MDAMLVVDMQVGLLNGEPFGCPFLFFLGNCLATPVWVKSIGGIGSGCSDPE
jgi:hypothetical protein